MNSPKIHILLPVGIGVLLASACSAQIGLALANTGPNGDPYVDAQYSPTLVPKSGITVEAWVTYDESTLGPGVKWPTIVRQDSTPGKTSYFLRVEAGSAQARVLSWAIDTSTGLQFVTYSFTPGELKKFTHVAGTFDGSAARLFVDGVLKQTSVNVGPRLTNRGHTLRIGNGDLSSPGGETWNGEIDEVRLWPYARTADEIKSTMNLALDSVPGLVSTWNLDFSPKDSSGSNDGVDVNNPTYAVNGLQLTSASLGGVGFGVGTAGCPDTPAAGISGLARVGSSALALMCVQANTGGPGFVWVGLGKSGSPIRLQGAGIWVDLGQPGLLVPATGNGDGLVRLPVSIPSVTPLGASVHCQFVFGQSGCSVPLFASQGVTITAR